MRPGTAWYSSTESHASQPETASHPPQSKHKQAWAPDVLFPPVGGEMMAALGSSIYRPALFQGPSKDRPRDKPEPVIFWAPSHPVQISHGTVAMSRAMLKRLPRDTVPPRRAWRVNNIEDWPDWNPREKETAAAHAGVQD